MRILIYGESPLVATGLAQVTRNIIEPLLAQGHAIELVAINHFYSGGEFPYVIHSCPSGDCTNEETAIERIHANEYDAFILSTDVGRYRRVLDALYAEQAKRKIYTIFYTAVDCDALPPTTFDDLEHFDVVGVYSQHGKRVIHHHNPNLPVSVIPLACEPEKFYPLTEEERRAARKELFDIEDDNLFLVVNVNRNQPRKDLARCIAIFHEFKKSHPNSALYLHCQQQDMAGHLPTQAHGVSALHDVIFTRPDFNILNGFDAATMNRIYNAADALFSTATGEGWGLATSEAMAAGTLVIVPRNTAFVEIVGENEERGLLIDSGGDLDHHMWFYGTGIENPRMIVHSESAIEKLSYAYDPCNYLANQTRVGKALLWAMTYDTAYVQNIWAKLFERLADDMGVEHPIPVTKDYGLVHLPYGNMLLNLHDPAIRGNIWRFSEIESLCQIARGVIYDIGANIGTHAISFAKQGDIVYAIEAQPWTYYNLCANLLLNAVSNVIPIHTALGSYDGQAQIFAIDPSVPQSAMGAMIVESGGQDVVMACLDTLVEKHHLLLPDFIKIDVEGHELEVIRGAMHLLTICAPIVYIEMHSEELATQTVELMARWGYNYQQICEIVSIDNPKQLLNKGFLFAKGPVEEGVLP